MYSDPLCSIIKSVDYFVCRDGHNTTLQEQYLSAIKPPNHHSHINPEPEMPKFSPFFFFL